MKELRQSDFSAAIPWAKQAAGDAVYALAIAEGIQSGQIFTDGDAMLFWHFCGFAYLSGAPNAHFLEQIAHDFIFLQKKTRRFILITDDDNVCAFFADFPQISAEKRNYYSFSGTPPQPDLPSGFRLQPIDRENGNCLNGRIIPAWSWGKTERFLQAGTGFCVMDGDMPAAWAFSAAVTGEAMDIGVETAEPYRRKGLAKCAAAAVMQAAAAQGKQPVWAHHAANIGSMKTAQALGFTLEKVCTVLHEA